ncbi:hypothetical protein Scep_001658 [Stephania cephalantha]|uniref:Endonuclease/exonuclease/phosphatase domain-containing protein n=1 Tax=Stephania cephalantha TaxID=152367 RepID=A0AAP0L8E4_9MAGN
MGDFNSIVSHEEKKGGLPWCPEENTKLMEFMNDIQATDLGFEGPKVTLSDRSRAEKRIMVRFDKAVANQGWLDCFPEARVANVYIPGSDHLALKLETKGRRRKGRGLFRFDNRLLKIEECTNLIDAVWREIQSNSNATLGEKMKRLANSILRWQRSTPLANSKRLLEEIHKQIKSLHDGGDNGMEQIKDLEQKLKEVSLDEEEYWRTRAHIEWIRSGDQNTVYFHSIGKGRRRRNLIMGLRNESGHMVHNQRNIMKSSLGKLFIPINLLWIFLFWRVRSQDYQRQTWAC